MLDRASYWRGTPDVLTVLQGTTETKCASESMAQYLHRGRRRRSRVGEPLLNVSRHAFLYVQYLHMTCSKFFIWICTVSGR